MKRLLEQPDNLIYNAEGIEINKKFRDLVNKFIEEEVGFDVNPSDLRHVLGSVLDLKLAAYYSAAMCAWHKKKKFDK